MNTEITRFDWLTWWVSGCILQSDPSWLEGTLFPDDPQKKRIFVHANVPLLSRYFNLPMQLPPALPAHSLMQIGALSVFQREQILNLMAAVCQPLASSLVTEEQATWCRRLAKAMRPGLWLSEQAAFVDQHAEALCVLRARYGETCWPRLRLLFPQHWVTRCGEPQYTLPAGRLTTLCDALVWKAAAVTQDESMS
ncbi:type III secretion protein [Brenneria rubrifaciens]|uniref:Type III secretion protein n=1 Tax=Brenneria rubrifaciens TaxID=55213 RepID=A0A4P8QYN3_9GAMM|nr:type III secretion protein [Brenneria rubrifaciens]QCR08544.1 type III secretion protein [Brenneria rubrifaciens]